MASNVEKILENMLGDDNVLDPPQSRVEEILQDTLDKIEYSDKPRSRVEALLIELQKEGSGSGGVTVEPLSVIENGVYTADTGKAYSPVTVNVPSGGGSSAPSKDVNFYDYDGTIVQSYTANEFAALSALPDNPSHDGLTAQGWNWLLSDAKAYVTKHGGLNIGQMYVTDDGKTRIYIHIDGSTPANRMTFYVRFASSVANNVTIDWGDGVTETKGSTSAANYPHTYASTGDFVITLTVNSGTISFVATNTASIYGPINTSTAHTAMSIQRIELGEKITNIGRYAFQGCRALTSVTIPDGVTSIDGYAFSNCYALTSVTIPDSVTSIGGYAFSNCYALTSVTIPDSVTSIDGYAFSNCYTLTSVTIPDSVTSIGTSTFMQCRAFTSVTIPDGVTSIGNGAFQYCWSLMSVTIPDSVTSIDAYAFGNCFALTSVTIPDGVTSIGGYAFSNCWSLMSVTIPDSVTSIGTSTFNSCFALTSVTIPDSVTSIGGYAFSNCYSLSECHLYPTTPPTLSSTNAFTSTPSDCIIYVPQGSLEAYRTATNWSTYASRMREEP